MGIVGYVSLSHHSSFLWMLKKSQGSFCSWLYVLGALLEDGVSLPGKLERKSTFRLIFGCWIIAGVFLTNCYNGIMITGLNSPLAVSSANTFMDLICDWTDFPMTYKEYAKMSNSYISKYSNILDAIIKYSSSVWTWYSTHEFDSNPPPFKFNISTLNKCFSLLSSPHDTLRYPKFIQTLEDVYFDYMQGYTWDDKKAQELSLNLLNPKQRHCPRNLTIHSKLGYFEQMKASEKEVVTCQKSVFAGQSGELDAEIEFYERKYPWIKFYRSKDTLLPSPYGISIMTNPELSKISRDAYSLIETGIYARLTKEKYERVNFRRKRAGEYKPLKDNKFRMDGCISTLFILWGGVSIVSILAFGAECRKKIVICVAIMGRYLKKRFESKVFCQKCNLTKCSLCRARKPDTGLIVVKPVSQLELIRIVGGKFYMFVITLLCSNFVLNSEVYY